MDSEKEEPKKKAATDKKEDKANPEDREKQWVNDPDVREQLDDLYDAVVKGFEDKSSQNSNIDRFWDVYNCVLNDNQAYNGESQVYVPLVHDAIEARVTRFTNALFPEVGRNVEVVNENGGTPHELVGVLEHYVDRTNLRENIVPALLRTGDVTGQYSLFVDWNVLERNVVRKVMKADVETELGTPVEGAETFEDIEYETIRDGLPGVMVMDSRDVLVLPATVTSIEDAEIVAVVQRLSKDKVRQKIDKEEFDEELGEQLLEEFDRDNNRQPNTQKDAAESAGVKLSGKSKCALVYMVWKKLKIAGKRRWCVTYFGGDNLPLSCKRNPYWNDRLPVLSQPALPVPGSFWGKSRVEFVEKLQYAANDAVNIGFDSAQYALLPIVVTDPEKNPRVGSMVLAMAAIWEADPNSTKFANFPQLWKDALQMVAMCKDQIMQSLGTNPAMMPHGNAGKKPTQAQVAQEQQVALESTNNEITTVETGILSPLLRWFYELDYQFRTKDIAVKQYGEMGVQAEMQQVPPWQVDGNYTFRWYGSEAKKSAQQVQQMISGLNILRGIPKEQLQGRVIDIAPIIEYVVGVVYGPRLAPRILIDQQHQLSMAATAENELLLENFPVQVHSLDDDMAHMQEHHSALQKGDPAGFIRAHILEHIRAAKAKAQVASPAPAGLPGAPGGAGPGLPGQPRIGASPAQPRPMQQPPGTIHQDQLVDPSRMPR